MSKSHRIASQHIASTGSTRGMSNFCLSTRQWHARALTDCVTVRKCARVLLVCVWLWNKTIFIQIPCICINFMCMSSSPMQAKCQHASASASTCRRLQWPFSSGITGSGWQLTAWQALANEGIKARHLAEVFFWGENFCGQLFVARTRSQ